MVKGIPFKRSTISLISVKNHPHYIWFIFTSVLFYCEKLRERKQHMLELPVKLGTFLLHVHEAAVR